MRPARRRCECVSVQPPWIVRARNAEGAGARSVQVELVDVGRLVWLQVLLYYRDLVDSARQISHAKLDVEQTEARTHTCCFTFLERYRALTNGERDIILGADSKD